MSRAPVIRLAFAAALLLALVAPLAVAAAPLHHPAPNGLLDPLRQWLHALWAADGVWIDPNGTRRAPAAAPRDLGAPRVSAGGAGKEGPRQQ
jgi:hypothetical protein